MNNDSHLNIGFFSPQFTHSMKRQFHIHHGTAFYAIRRISENNVGLIFGPTFADF